MEEKRFKKVVIFSLIAIFITISGLCVAFANQTAELKVIGTAKVNKTKWEIKFDNLSTPTTMNGVTIDTAPTIQNDSTYIGDYRIVFTKPNSSVSYTFDVVNNGTFDAKLNSLTIPTSVCTGNGADATIDATNVCNYLTYTLTKADGSPFSVNSIVSSENSVSLKLTLSYGDIPQENWPKDDVEISNLQIAANFISE